jgi:hypothetical protein
MIRRRTAAGAQRVAPFALTTSLRTGASRAAATISPAAASGSACPPCRHASRKFPMQAPQTRMPRRSFTRARSTAVKRENPAAKAKYASTEGVVWAGPLTPCAPRRRPAAARTAFAPSAGFRTAVRVGCARSCLLIRTVKEIHPGAAAFRFEPRRERRRALPRGSE